MRVCRDCDHVWFPRACGWYYSSGKSYCPDCCYIRKYDLTSHCPRGNRTSDHLCVAHAGEFTTHGRCTEIYVVNADYDNDKGKNAHDKGGAGDYVKGKEGKAYYNGKGGAGDYAYDKGYDNGKGKNGYDKGNGKNGYDNGYGYGKDNRDHGDRDHGGNAGGGYAPRPPPPPPPPTTTAPPGDVAATWTAMWGGGVRTDNAGGASSSMVMLAIMKDYNSGDGDNCNAGEVDDDDGNTGDGDDNGKGDDDDDDSKDDAPPLARRCDAQTSTSGETLRMQGVKCVLRQIEPQDDGCIRP